jgi:hypothetical protein
VKKKVVPKNVFLTRYFSYICFHAYRSTTTLCSKKEKDLLGKVQYFANQLQQYRFDSQNSLVAAKEASEKKEKQLKDEIRGLRTKVEELEGEYSKAKTFTETLIKQRDECGCFRIFGVCMFARSEEEEESCNGHVHEAAPVGGAEALWPSHSA